MIFTPRVIIYFVIIVIIAISIWGVILLFFRISKKELSFENRALYKSLIFASTSFAFLGFSIGLLTSLNRVSIAGAVLPAMLTFIGSFVAYMFITKKFNPENRLSAIAFLYTISFFMTVGHEIGAWHRVNQEDFEVERELNNKQRLLYYEKKLDLEFELNKKRLKDSLIIFEDLPSEEVPPEPGDPDDL